MFMSSVMQIDNGFVIQHPPSNRVMNRGQEQQQQQPVSHHVDDFESFVVYMKSIWPINITDK